MLSIFLEKALNINVIKSIPAPNICVQYMFVWALFSVYTWQILYNKLSILTTSCWIYHQQNGQTLISSHTVMCDCISNNRNNININSPNNANTLPDLIASGQKTQCEFGVGSTCRRKRRRRTGTPLQICR